MRVCLDLYFEIACGVLGVKISLVSRGVKYTILDLDSMLFSNLEDVIFCLFLEMEEAGEG